VTILPDVTIESASQNGVSSILPDSVLVNKGNIIAQAGDFGVLFGSLTVDSSVSNARGAFISGGVAMEGSGSQIVNNFGTVIGDSSKVVIAFRKQSQDVSLNNHGEIIGDEKFCVVILSNFSGGSITNSSLIDGAKIAIGIGSGAFLKHDHSQLFDWCYQKYDRGCYISRSRKLHHTQFCPYYWRLLTKTLLAFVTL
jgi:hypothetical protein